MKYIKNFKTQNDYDNYVAEGLLPKGIKEAGYKELSWYKRDLDKFILECKNTTK